MGLIMGVSESCMLNVLHPASSQPANSKTVVNSHNTHHESLQIFQVDLYAESKKGIRVMENIESITKTNVQETVQQVQEVSKQIVKIKLPMQLTMGGGAKTIEVVIDPNETTTVATALQQMLTSMEGTPLSRKLFDGQGTLTANMNVYVNGKNIQHSGSQGTVKLGNGMATVLKANDQLDILPAVAGG